ncbi:cytidylate kinase-like family protein [Lachnospiraceae bacterium ZAX-1]
MDKFVLAITRSCGSGGTSIAKIFADEFGIAVYDRELLRIASLDSGINEQLFAEADERIRNSLLYRVSKKVYQKSYQGELISPESSDFTSNDNLFNYQAKVLCELAEKESFVVIGRAADYVLKDHPNLCSVFLYASDETCIAHEAEWLGVSENKALKYIRKMNKYRSEYYTYYTGKTWENAQNFDMSIDTGKLGHKKTVELIKSYMVLRGML